MSVQRSRKPGRIVVTTRLDARVKEILEEQAEQKGVTFTEHLRDIANREAISAPPRQTLEAKAS